MYEMGAIDWFLIEAPDQQLTGGLIPPPFILCAGGTSRRLRVPGFERTIIDGRTDRFCKLIVDRPTALILGCHARREVSTRERHRRA